MSNRSGSPYSTPRDANRVPFLTAASTADGITPVVLEADPTTHLLQVSSSGGGGGGTQYTDGASTIAHPIGTIPVYDKAGTITSVSVANPLPVTANISGTWNTGTPSATINIGQTTSAVTATQLTASSIAMTNGVVIQALSTNTASVFIGNSGVTTANGFELTAGSSLTISPSNINLVYVIGANATDKVCWSVT